MTRPSSEPIIRQTSQRETILRVIENSDRPLTAPEIHEIAQKVSRNLGLRTVQRHMNCLVELNKIEWLSFLGLPKRYQLVDLPGDFSYAICSRCRAVYRIPIPDNLDVIACQISGFTTERSVWIYSGHCDACKISSCNNGDEES